MFGYQQYPCFVHCGRAFDIATLVMQGRTVFPTVRGGLSAGRSSLGRKAGPTGWDILIQGRGVDGGGQQGTAGDGRGWLETAEDGRGWPGKGEDGQGWWGTTGDSGGRRATARVMCYDEKMNSFGGVRSQLGEHSRSEHWNYGPL